MLLVLTLALALQDKTYDLKLAGSRQTGQKYRLEGSQHLTLKMSANGQPAGGREEKKLFEGAEEVVSADAQGAYELRWTFTKAERLQGGALRPFGFVGKTVVVKRASKEAEKTFAYLDGGEIADEDLKGLREVDGDGKGDASKAFAPAKPVKAGETWEPDLRAVAAAFEKGMAESLVPEKSKASFTLKSVERRDGLEFGRIEGVLELALGAFGPLKLGEPIVMKLGVEMDVCVDGTAQVGVMKMKAEMKGGAEVENQGQKVQLGIDLTMVGLKNKALQKP